MCRFLRPEYLKKWTTVCSTCHCCNEALESTLSVVRTLSSSCISSRLIKTWKLKGWVEASPRCSLHHFNLCWIHVSLLKKRTSTGLVHNASTGNPLESSPVGWQNPIWIDLVYIAVQCRNSEGRHGTYRPRYHIGYHEKVRQSNWASVFALVPRSALDVEGWSICTLQERHLRSWENSFDLQKDWQALSAVDTLPSCNWTLQEFMRKCHSLSFPASVWAARGLSKLLAANGDMSSKQSTASELVGNRYIWTYVYFDQAILYFSCLSWLFRLFLVRWQFAWFAEGFRIWYVCKKHPKTHVLNPCRKPNPRLSGCDISDRTGILGLPPPPRKFSHYSSPSWRPQRHDSTLWSAKTAPRKNQWPRLRPRANAIKTGAAWQSHEP